MNPTFEDTEALMEDALRYFRKVTNTSRQTAQDGVLATILAYELAGMIERVSKFVMPPETVPVDPLEKMFSDLDG